MATLTASEIESVLRAYAAGDAFGVAYEFQEFRSEVNPDVLCEKIGWPYGGVSDDTLLTLLTIDSLDIRSAEKSREKFLLKLKESVSILRGLGPTTRSALGLPIKDHERGQVGISNGALMRTSLLGLAFSHSESAERRHFVRALTEATHKSPSAIGCALIGSALFSDAMEFGSTHSPFEIAERERSAIDIEIELRDWQEPICTGVSNDSTETLNAVLWALKSSNSARDALQISCELGGDTDTVAALTSALLVARKRIGADLNSIPWLKLIQWQEVLGIPAASERLHQMYKEKKKI